AQMIRLGEAGIVLSGGIENMSQAPHVIRGLRSGLRLNQGKLEDYLYEALLDPYCGLFMAQTAEKCAGKYGISRQEQDAYAIRSQQAAAKAWAEGKFSDEVVPVEIKTRKGVTVVDRDDHLRPDTTMEGLAKLPAAFSKDGTVTAGNASGIVDGGAAILLASAGVDASFMGMGPAPATRKVLEMAGLRLDQMDLIEVNEAFAGQYLAVEKELGLDRNKTNVNGGAIALGHPLGMTGTRLILTLTHELRRRGQQYGLATACIGGGQGIAAIIERV